MTTTTHDSHIQHTHTRLNGDAARIAGQRRWLIPALGIAAAIAIVLVTSGIVSASLVIYAGALAGCGLLHIFGHGSHSGHGGGTPPGAK